MNSKLTESLDKAALAVGFVLFFGIMISTDLRNSLGVFTGHLIGWLPDILPFHVVLFILAAVTGLYASLIQKYTMDWDFLRAQQEKMKACNAKAADKKGDERKAFMKECLSGGNAADNSGCSAKAVDKNGKPLAGAAKDSFMKKCQADAGAAK